MAWSRRFAAVLVMSVVAGCSGGTPSSSTNGTAPDVEGIDLLAIGGPGGSARPVDDGRVELVLRTDDEFVTYEVSDDDRDGDTHRVEQLGTVWDVAELDSVPPSATVTVSGAGDTVSLHDVAVVDHDGELVLAGVPSGALPPPSFARWAMYVHPVDAEPDTTAPTASLGAAGEVLELTDAEVADALAAAPVPASVVAVDVAGDDVVPTGFAAEARLSVPVGADYDVDVNTPGSPDPRPLQARVRVAEGSTTVVSGGGNVAVVGFDDHGGQGLVTLRAGGFDVGATSAVSVQVRRVDDGGTEPVWADRLGCVDGVESFRWRNPGSDDVRTGQCPQPYRWVTSSPVVPMLQPGAAQVAAAARFATVAPLADHLGALFDATVGPAPRSPARTVTVEVAAAVPLTAGGDLRYRLPVTLAVGTAAQLDPVALAATIAHWRTATATSVDGFELSVTVSAPSGSRGPLLAARDVYLPATSIS